MNLHISTNLLSTSERQSVFYLLSSWSHINLGVEIFPHFEVEGYSQILDKCACWLKEVPVSFHGPYTDTEHSAKKGSKAYEIAMDYCKRTFDYAARFESKHIVFHHNNCPIAAEDRGDMILHATENLAELTALARKHGLKLLVENAGIRSHGNMLFDEKEFIELFDSAGHGCLFDVGHANCNNWDIKNIMSSLGEKIECYHLHNNYGNLDDHNRIMEGEIDMGMIFDLYSLYTPDANIVVEYRPGLLDSPYPMQEDIQYILENIKMNRGFLTRKGVS